MIRKTFATTSLAAAAALLAAACGSSESGGKTTPTPTPIGTSAAIERGRTAGADDVTALIGELTSNAAVTRRDAAYGLGIALMMGATSDALAPALAKASGGETDEPARGAMLWALGRLGDAAALPPLSAALGDKKVAIEVRTEAALALAVLGRAQVALTDLQRGQLVELATSEVRDARYAATLALAREHEPPVDPVVLRTLTALVTDADAEVRAAAVLGLARRRRGGTEMLTALDDVDWRVSVEAARGLLALKSPAGLRGLGQWIYRHVNKNTARSHPVRVALEGFAEMPELGHAQRAGRVAWHQGRRGRSLDEGQIRCLGQGIVTRLRGRHEALRRCGGTNVPAWWRAQVIAAALAGADKTPAADRARQLAELAKASDPRARAAAVAAASKLAITPARDAAIEIVRAALSDSSVAVAGTAADAITALSLDDVQLASFAAIIVPRTQKELAGDGELGLTLLRAIAASKMIAGTEVCSSAATHANRTVRAAASDCLTALGIAQPTNPPPPERAAAQPAAGGRWILETTRGTITIELEPAVAPRHVAAITKLTNEKFYDGLVFHRVVPNFVVQGGDPTGTGWGGPDFVIPAEPSPLPFARGAVGIADAGPDTGGSQLFIMHTRAPRLEGRYTRVGMVTSGLEVVDRLAVGDVIRSARIETASR